MSAENPDKQQNQIKQFFNLTDIWYYITGRKKSVKKDVNIKMMHWMNRLAIVVFLIAIIIWMIKRLG